MDPKDQEVVGIFWIPRIRKNWIPTDQEVVESFWIPTDQEVVESFWIPTDQEVVEGIGSKGSGRYSKDEVLFTCVIP